MVTESAVNIGKEYLWSLPPEFDVKRAYILDHMLRVLNGKIVTLILLWY